MTSVQVAVRSHGYNRQKAAERLVLGQLQLYRTDRNAKPFTVQPMIEYRPEKAGASGGSRLFNGRWVRGYCVNM
jgi:hypothetical protein